MQFVKDSSESYLILNYITLRMQFLLTTQRKEKVRENVDNFRRCTTKNVYRKKILI